MNVTTQNKVNSGTSSAQIKVCKNITPFLKAGFIHLNKVESKRKKLTDIGFSGG
jgi:hypothetical protein